MMKRTWILVIGKAAARILESENKESTPRLIRQYDNPAGRMKERDLVSSAPGRSDNPRGPGSHPLPPHHSMKEHEVELFFKEVVSDLVKSHRGKAFDELVVVAEPGTLGKLRATFSHNKELHVSKEIHHDLVESTDEQVRAHVWP